MSSYTYPNQKHTHTETHTHRENGRKKKKMIHPKMNGSRADDDDDKAHRREKMSQSNSSSRWRKKIANGMENNHENQNSTHYKAIIFIATPMPMLYLLRRVSFRCSFVYTSFLVNNFFFLPLFFIRSHE